MNSDLKQLFPGAALLGMEQRRTEKHGKESYLAIALAPALTIQQLRAEKLGEWVVYL